MLIDTGTMPSGTTEQQIDASSDNNFETPQVLNQSIRRYNQMFAGSQTITIAGDFSLHAGDVVFVDTQAEMPKRVIRLTNRMGVYILSWLTYVITYQQKKLIRN